MVKIRYFLVLCMVPVMFSCSPKTTASKSKTGTYHEDLSNYRPSFQTDTIKEQTMPQGHDVPQPVYGTAVNDVSRQLNRVLDSLETRNSDQKVLQGYTIQVYSGNNRDAANEAKSSVYKLLPDSRPETTYVQPNYKVKVGKYLTRMEAQKLYAKLRSDFPGAMVIPEKINLSRY